MESIEKIVEQNVLQAAKIVEDQLDAEIEKLEKMDDDELEVLREKRLAAMKKQMTQRNEWLTLGHGEYSELADQMEFFEACKKSKHFICHFYRTTTFRCKIVDKHLEILAKKHIEARFCKIDAEKSPFLTERLKIKVLPTIVLCKDSITKDFIVGFDDLGGIDEFSTEMMEWRIAQAGVINYDGDLLVPPGTSTSKPKKPILGYQKIKTIRGGKGDSDDDDDD